jgi:hypothetical protein
MDTHSFRWLIRAKIYHLRNENELLYTSYECIIIKKVLKREIIYFLNILTQWIVENARIFNDF